MPSDLRTRAIVLRRTNYGESDRILNLLTPEGKVAVLAKGVRKEKSRLAGGIELFSISDVVIHQGRSNLGILTGAKMLQFFGNIISDLARLELAAGFMKKLDRASEQIPSPDHYDLLVQSLKSLNLAMSGDLVSTWFILNLARINGETINFFRDTAGNELSPDQTYIWDPIESALRPDPSGPISAREIKLARFLLSNPLSHAEKIENLPIIIPPILDLAKKIEQNY